MEISRQKESFFSRIVIDNKYFSLSILVLISIFGMEALYILKPNGIELYSKLDNYIPFVPEFIVFYVLFFVFTPIPIIIFWKRKNINNIIRSFIMVNAISLITYLFMQTEINRPEINPNNSIFEKIVQYIYSTDQSKNLMPSLHVSLSLLTALWIAKYYPKIKIPILILGSLIAISTVFVKQHVLIDVPTGLLLGIGAYLYYSKKCN